MSPDQERDRRPSEPHAAGEPQARPHHDWSETHDDPGSYIGRLPERAAETIPGGVGRGDERIAANSTQSSGVGRPDVRGQPSEEPGGHREGDAASDSQRREAGQNR